ncbi:DUF541 domain-containing protein [Colwellia echini]|uniref:DUF541 domain-containing protein n=2 Tax=Colwellia echini TaxID=1982103 RepID=A0ABY3N0I5_9GAMM|nr:DUF541 domain-containing protein [Colwellia echini]
MSLLCLPLLCLLLPVELLAADDDGIEVSGQGSIEVVPDQFSLTLTITERGRIPNKLKSLVDKKSTSVVNAALKLGVKDTNISSARVNLRIVEEVPAIQVQAIELNKGREGSVFVDGQNVNQQQNSNNQHKNPLFELSRQVSVNFTKIDQYDDFLSDIIKINVSHISSLSMNVEKRDEYYQQALVQAISHAQHKAGRMANQAGKKLGDLQFIKEVSSNSYRPMYAEPMMRSSSSVAHTSLTGNQTISARVSVKFSLED